LRALVDWSYALLTEGEQRLLARVSVFAGSWDLAAAEAVCSGDGLAEYEVLDGLTNLINKSLVMLDKTGAEVRYYLLETIRQYGLEKLKAGGEEAAVRQRHFAYYIKLGSELETKILGTDQLKGLKLLAKELDNLRTALDYSLETAQFEAVIAVMTVLFIYWDCRGYYSELRRYVEQALALPTATGAARGIGLFHAGFLASMQGDYEASRSYYKESLALSREYSDNKELAMVALGGMGLMQLHLGNYAEARDYFQGSLALLEEDSRFYKAARQQNLGLVLKELGEYEQAHRLFEASLAIGRELGNPWLLGYHLRALGELALILEEYDRAHSYLVEALELGEEIGFNLGKPQILTMLGIVYAVEGKFKEARQALEVGLTIDWQSGYTVYTTRTMVAVVGLLNRVWLQEKQPDLVTQIACLCGMISAWYTSRQVRSQLPDRTYYEQGLAVARSGLDEATFEAAFARSQAMSAEEATIYARQALAGI
jgi:tetratricopeptide (TPR) repeat protein